MSTITTQTNAAGQLTADSDGRLPLDYSPLRDEPTWGGLPTIVWVKIAVITLLMAALYWANLSRLWLKTNPFTGQGNWEHAVVIPLIGIYYLYIWRDQLLGHVKPDPDADRWSLPGIWALIMGVPLLLALAAIPVAMTGLGNFSPGTLLASFADSGLSKLAPAVVGILAVCCAVGGFVYYKRQELLYPATQTWINSVWTGLGVWLLSMTVAWGLFFFFVVLVPGEHSGVLHGVGIGLTVIGLAGLAHVAYWGSSKLWRERYDAILARSSAWFGGYIMVWGILFSFWGIYPGQNDFFKDIGMVVALFGVVTLVAGWRVMKIAWFPIVFLFCAIPWPDQVYSWVALPLQNFAAKIGVFALTVTGVDADKFGTKIAFTDANGKPEMLNVAEACAGLKSLMTFISVGAAVAFLSTRMLWQKLVIVASAVPIAILCNASRVAGQGLLHRYVSPEWSQNFAHAFAGLVMLIPGFFLILLVCWVIDHLFVEEADEATLTRAARTTAAHGAKQPVAAAADVPAAPSAKPTAAVPAASATPAPAPVAAKPVAAKPAETAAPAARKVITIPKKSPATKMPSTAVAAASQSSPQTTPSPAASAPAAAAPVRKPAATKPVAQPTPAAVKSPGVSRATAATPTTPKPQDRS